MTLLEESEYSEDRVSEIIEGIERHGTQLIQYSSDAREIIETSTKAVDRIHELLLKRDEENQILEKKYEQLRHKYEQLEYKYNQLLDQLDKIKSVEIKNKKKKPWFWL